MSEHLERFAVEARDWETLATPIEGVFVVKPQAKKGESPTLMLEICPVNAEGKPTGRSKIYLRSKDVFLRLAEALNSDKTFKLVEAIELFNAQHQRHESATKTGKPMLKIE